MISDYIHLDGLDLAERIAKGELSVLEVTEDAIQRIQAVNPQLNAVVFPLYEAALERAKNGELPSGPFHGVPMVVKDMGGFFTGAPYTMGSRFLKGFEPKYDATVMKRLKASGVNVLAKSSCPELGLLGVTEPECYGPTRSPWSLDKSPGGSSGGSAALVAARAVPLGHGGDGGGSLRLPANACGLFALKSTRGRVPLGPDLGEGWGGLVQPGVMTRSVRDCAAMLDIMAGPELGMPYHAPPLERPLAEEVGRPCEKLKIAVSMEAFYGDELDKDCRDAVEAAIKLCEDLGHDVEEATPEFDKEAMIQAYLTQVSAAVSAEIYDAEHWMGRRAKATDFEPSTWFMKQVGEALSAGDLHRARDLAQYTGLKMGPFFQKYDCLLSATAARPPIDIGEFTLKSYERLGLGTLRALGDRKSFLKVLTFFAQKMLSFTPNTQLFNQTGYPAMSVPLHWNAAGLPIGVQFAGAFGSDGRLIRLASQLEQAKPWRDKLPPLHA